MEEPGAELSAADSVWLLNALSSAPDPRKRRGIRHSMQSILLLVVGAVIRLLDAAHYRWRAIIAPHLLVRAGVD